MPMNRHVGWMRAFNMQAFHAHNDGLMHVIIFIVCWGLMRRLLLDKPDLRGYRRVVVACQ